MKTEKLMMKISLISGMFFVVMELFMSISTKSQAVLMDAVFDASELIVIGLSIVLIPLFYRPITEKKPYGYAQFESVFILIKGFMFLSVTIGLFTSNVEIMLSGGREIQYHQVVWFEFILASISIGVYFILKHYHKGGTSPIIEAELYDWKIDFLCSIGLCVAFGLQPAFQELFGQEIGRYADQIIAMAIALFMIPHPVRMIISALKSVFLFSPDVLLLEEIKIISAEVLLPYDIDITFYDVVKTGRKLWISIYFTQESDAVSLRNMGQAYQKLREKLAEHYDSFYLELIPEIGNCNETITIRNNQE